MRGQFNSPITLPRGSDEVPVSGPLLDVEPDAVRATIVCVLVQSTSDDPDNAVWVEGRGTWERGQNDWQGSVSRSGRKPGGASGMLRADGGDVRGIAKATIVRDGSVEDGRLVPPSLDTITWCVGVHVRDEGGAGTGEQY
jgi:hypothetical protein